MILTKLVLTNFKRYKSFTLEFDEGLTGIIGRNGAGKSTIFDAVFYALFGEVKDDKAGIKYAHADEKERVEVVLDFEIEGIDYRVVRELRGKSQTAIANLYKHESELIASQAREVTNAISKLIGMTKDAFEHTVFASQKELTALSDIKSEERKKIIRKLLGLEKIDKIEDEIRSRLTNINREIKGFGDALLSDEAQKEIEAQKQTALALHEHKTKELALTTKHFAESSVKLTLITHELDALQKLKEENQNLQKAHELTAQNLANQSKNHQEKTAKLAELNAKATQYETQKPLLAQYAELTQKLATLQKQKELTIALEGLRAQYKQYQKEIAELSHNLEAKPTLTKSLEETKALHEASVQALKNIEQAELAIQNELAKTQATIDDSQKKVDKIVSIGKDSACPVCTRPLLEEYDNVIASLQKTIGEFTELAKSKAQNELKTIQEQKLKTQEEKLTHEKKINELETSLKLLANDEKNLALKKGEFEAIEAKGKANKQAMEALGLDEYDPQAHEALITQKQALEPKQTELIGLASLIATIPALSEELATLAQHITQTQAELEAKKQAHATHAYNPQTHEDKAKEHAEASKIKEELVATQLSQTKECEVINGEVKMLQTKLDTNNRQKEILQTKQNDKNDYEKLKVFMGEFKNRINSKVAPRISAIASEMYGTITRGKYQHIEVSDEFDFYIFDEGVRYPIARFSGGERDLANLVLRIAISKTLGELGGSGGGVGFLAFDEVFGSQDDERRMQIMEAFHTIKEQYRQIFLISHESEIKEMFERVVEV